MPTSIRLKLPYPPSVNAYWRRRGNIYYIQEKGKIFRNNVCKIAKELNINCMRGNVKVVVWVYVPDKRIRDIDNLNKAILDSLTFAQIIEDDFYVDDIRIVRSGYSKKNGYIDLSITSIDPISYQENT